MNDYQLMTSELRDELTCVLCQDMYDKPQALIPCLHTLCLDCISCLPKTNEENDAFNCPICRGTVNKFTNNFSIQNVIDILQKAIKSQSSANKNQEELMTKNIGQQQQNHTAATAKDLNDINIQNSNLIEEPSSSSSVSVRDYTHAFNNHTKKTCRSCIQGNENGFTCPIPITDDEQDGFGHILCGYCGEYMPARGLNENEPALNQCCNFCGVVACDEYWKCKNRSIAAKLYILNDITDIESWLENLDSIEMKEEGHLNKAEIQLLKQYLNENNISWTEAWNTCLYYLDESIYTSSIVRRMTQLGLQVYNTRLLPGSEVLDECEDDSEEEDYYDRIEQEGIKPSQHLRACYTCLATIVNGQFYGYWKHIIRDGSIENIREMCPHGIQCEAQWRRDTHAQRLSHIEI
ncbi:uncharacterized protein BX663DRAFT_521833 [Cokeromyces recurvatus]|uniref:uncharacterized protein n=1 Tax=Cokeromyces recurvatus TaxID=90255 RepID=UPI0022212376|nr:uncharacterized protein BX663DRAFT_521833 [Cokeromyces recurvatus]KAI7899219.1 hypothetical protein BX663DRAFT_521833 [Cokeromyces recurvatus]